MVLNGIIDIQNEELEEPSFEPQPGWDDLEWDDNQDPNDHE